MPYIKCSDGQTYSRYDKSQYVQDCIKCEEHKQDPIYNACIQDPTCYQERIDSDKTIDYIMIGFIIFSIIFIIILIKKL